MEKQGFAQKHGDTIAIIASTLGANIAIAAIMISMWASNTHRIDATNARLDGLYNQVIEIIKASKQPEAPKHLIGWRPYEDIVSQPTDWMIQDTNKPFPSTLKLKTQKGE